MLDPHAELLRINARIKEILLQHMPRTGTYHSLVPGLATRRLETCHTTTTCLGKPSEFSVIPLRQLLISEHRLPFLLCFFSYLWLWPDVEKHKSKSHLIFELCDGTCYFLLYSLISIETLHFFLLHAIP